MAELVLIYGQSGSGKSRSICSFGEREVLVYQCEKKRLPARTNFKYIMQYDRNKGMADNIKRLKTALYKMPTNAAVIDDLTYLSTNMFMDGHRNKKNSFELYDDIADMVWDVFKFIKDGLPDDKIVYIIMHEDTTDLGNTKLRTIGRLLDNKVCLEGMTTICLRCMSSLGRHFFKTVTDGNDITKSPEGMFPEEIDNDLRLVDTTIREYYGMAPLTVEQADNTTAEADEKESA